MSNTEILGFSQWQHLRLQHEVTTRRRLTPDTWPVKAGNIPIAMRATGCAFPDTPAPSPLTPLRFVLTALSLVACYTNGAMQFKFWDPLKSHVVVEPIPVRTFFTAKQYCPESVSWLPHSPTKGYLGCFRFCFYETAAFCPFACPHLPVGPMNTIWTHLQSI